MGAGVAEKRITRITWLERAHFFFLLPPLHHQFGLRMSNETYDKLLNTLIRDCTVLESFKIMDYSLLMGVHNPAAGG